MFGQREVPSDIYAKNCHRSCLRIRLRIFRQPNAPVFSKQICRAFIMSNNKFDTSFSSYSAITSDSSSNILSTDGSFIQFSGDFTRAKQTNISSRRLTEWKQGSNYTHSTVAVCVHQLPKWHLFLDPEFDNRIVLSQDFQVDVLGFTFLQITRSTFKFSSNS